MKVDGGYSLHSIFAVVLSITAQSSFLTPVCKTGRGGNPSQWKERFSDEITFSSNKLSKAASFITLQKPFLQRKNT